MENLPFYIYAVFALTTLLTVFLLYRAAGSPNKLLLLLIGWLLLQAIIAKTGFYTNTTSLPPHFAFAIVPPLLLIAFLFITPAGKKFIDTLNVKTLTLLHIVRIPVELVLLSLFMYKVVPQQMTFEGRNFDILSGLTAPLVYYFVFIKKMLGTKYLLLWNLACTILLVNIVTIAILSAPFPFQKLAFEQPNIAVLYFPFIWLPCCIVPVALFAHLVSIKQLMMNNKKALQ